MDAEIILKRGQVTIFIILGIVLVVGIVALFIFLGGSELEAPNELGVRQFIEKCVSDVIEESSLKVMKGGGRISPVQFMMYQGSPYNYLCYNGDYYQSCYNTYPDLGGIIESEILKDTKPGVQDCFDSLRGELKEKGFVVFGDVTSYSVKLVPKKIRVVLRKKISITKDSVSQSFENFDFDALSPLYEFVGIAREIVNSEALYCNFEYNGYMLLHPEYDIRRWAYKESRLYRIIERRSGSEFKFAVRSCAFPPGI